MSGGAVGTGSDLDDEADRFWRSTAMATGIGAILWVGIMFALGAVLAVSIPRVPRLASLTGQSRSSRELWLERFYLVALTVGLLGFYASVPLVAVEVLAVTLALFGLLLAVRIIHFGVLHRGLWAFWNVLRCAAHRTRRRRAGHRGHEHRASQALRDSRFGCGPPEDATGGQGICDALGEHRRETGRLRAVRTARQTTAHAGTGHLDAAPAQPRRVLSILAHEYGHFSHDDTFYSRFIFQVSASLATSLAVMSTPVGS